MMSDSQKQALTTSTHGLFAKDVENLISQFALNDKVLHIMGKLLPKRYKPDNFNSSQFAFVVPPLQQQNLSGGPASYEATACEVDLKINYDADEREDQEETDGFWLQRYILVCEMKVTQKVNGPKEFRMDLVVRHHYKHLDGNTDDSMMLMRCNTCTRRAIYNHLAKFVVTVFYKQQRCADCREVCFFTGEVPDLCDKCKYVLP